MAEEAEHLAFHVGDVVRPVTQHLVLQRTVLVHDGVHEVENLALAGLVDIVILFAHDGRYCQPFAQSSMSTPETTRRVTRVQHELKRRELTVARVASLSPNVRSVTLSGES